MLLRCKEAVLIDEQVLAAAPEARPNDRACLPTIDGLREETRQRTQEPCAENDAVARRSQP